MRLTLHDPVLRFCLASLCILGSSLYVTSLPVFFQSPNYLSLGVTIDLTFGIPLLFYLLMVRQRNWSPVLIVPVFVATLLLASLILPLSHQYYLHFAQQGLVVAELFLLLFGLYKIRALVKSFRSIHQVVPDLPEKLRLTLDQVMGAKRVNGIVASEMATLYYALFFWRIKKEALPAQTQFTYHRQSGYVAIWCVLMFVTILETAGLHLLVMRWSNLAAWVVTAFSLYGFLFFAADLAAILKRPIVLTGNQLYIRTGLRWRVNVPLAQIDRVEKVSELARKDKKTLSATLLGSPDLLIYLRSEVKAEGMYGISKRINRIALQIDQSEELIKAIRPLNDEPEQ